MGGKGIGVAPGARWMACRNMDRGFGSSETYLNCLQFFLAPTDLEVIFSICYTYIFIIDRLFLYLYYILTTPKIYENLFYRST